MPEFSKKLFEAYTQDCRSALEQYKIIKYGEAEYIQLKDAKAGDLVEVISLATGGVEMDAFKKVSRVTQKFDENTGIPYNVLRVWGADYDSRTGCSINEKYGTSWIQPAD